ncbi:MAG: molybdopterin cofactor-binding domain-containing protein [Dehalococcoidales bacterium]
MADELTVIGKPGNIDQQAVECVTGTIEFPNDLFMGQKLHAKILGCPHAHAKVVSIDASKALELDGVEAVVTHEDVPGWSEVKFHVGDAVAAVAAKDENTAAHALTLIKVTYETRAHVVDPDEAMEPGAPLVGLFPDGNTTLRTDIVRGDVEAGFAQADVTIEDESGWTNRWQNAPMGGGNTTAWWQDDILHAWVDTQNPHGEHSGFAGFFALPHNKVRVFTHAAGGGFGGGRAAVQAVAAALAKKTGKIVSLHTDKRDNFFRGVTHFACKSKIKLGAKSDGTLTAIDAQFWGDGGTNPSPPYNALPDCLQIGFRCPNANFKVTGVITNAPPSGYYRCVQHPPGAFLMNTALDAMAEKLGMDPLDFRLKNILTIAEPDQDSGVAFSFNTLRECLLDSAAAIGYASNKHAPGARTLDDGRKHGMAVTGHLDGHGGYGSGRGAIITLRPDGTCFINAGIARSSCGTNTAHCHFVAETLGLKYDDVKTGDWGATAVTADGGMQAGSTNTNQAGAAFTIAARDAREQLFKAAAKMFDPQVNPEDLDARDSKIFLKSNPSKSITHKEVCARNQRIIGRASAGWNPVLQFDVGPWKAGTPANQRVPCAAGAEVAVDTESGEVEVLKWTAVTDIGRVIYYDGAHAQAWAGLYHMFWQAFFAEHIYDRETGISLNPNFLNHRWPASLDIPYDALQEVLREGVSGLGPYGATGAGEPVASQYSVIACAIYNAIGVWIKEPPFTPWKILKALGKA